MGRWSSLGGAAALVPQSQRDPARQENGANRNLMEFIEERSKSHPSQGRNKPWHRDVLENSWQKNSWEERAGPCRHQVTLRQRWRHRVLSWDTRQGQQVGEGILPELSSALLNSIPRTTHTQSSVSWDRQGLENPPV